MIPQNYSNGDQMGYFMPSNASGALNPNLTVESSRVSPAILSKNDIKTNSKEIDALIVVKMHSSEITMYLQVLSKL